MASPGDQEPAPIRITVVYAICCGAVELSRRGARSCSKVQIVKDDLDGLAERAAVRHQVAPFSGKDRYRGRTRTVMRKHMKKKWSAMPSAKR